MNVTLAAYFCRHGAIALHAELDQLSYWAEAGAYCDDNSSWPMG